MDKICWYKMQAAHCFVSLTPLRYHRISFNGSNNSPCCLLYWTAAFRIIRPSNWIYSLKCWLNIGFRVFMNSQQIRSKYTTTLWHRGNNYFNLWKILVFIFWQTVVEFGLVEKVCRLFCEVSYIQKHTFLPSAANNRMHTTVYTNTKVQSATA